MTTLEEAIAQGRGIERPFRCHVHGDKTASASVNVIKNVWYCYACRAKGVVDSNRVPTISELEAMLEPETAGRTFPVSWLDTFGHGGYWLDRFPDWVCWFLGLGEDPWSGEPVFPVHTPRGRLAGVGRRQVMPGPGPRYRYPYHWSASRTLFGSRGNWTGPACGVIVLVEGAADAASLWEKGFTAYATYGAGLHMPQVELIQLLGPKLVLTGFDMDDAGDMATDMTERMLRGIVDEVSPITWPAKDPADSDPVDRIEAVLKAVTDSRYGQPLTDEVHDHAVHVQRTLKTEYRKARDG